MSAASVLWVTARYDDALRRSCQFNTSHQNNGQVKFIAVGESLCGEGFDEIILDNIYAEALKREHSVGIISDCVFRVCLRHTITEWVREHLIPRLNGPESVIRELVDYESPAAT